ncbi:MAG TPA: CHAD domain-containing protein [Phenylobacterium sp.]|jgi:inorganic triphosphatase YgiF|nr:CHAD domain-containing protein [Phenylobacterium sp.]
MASYGAEGPDREIELKFACGPEDLAVVLAAAPAGDDETRELISVYFDTADLVLQKAGASLRVREHKGRRMQTLKRGRGFIREEHEAPIDGLAPDPALEPLPSLLPHGADLRPAFNVRVSRRQRTIRYKGALIEMALDQGEVCGGERKSPICEVELELKAGEPTMLFALARELSAAAPLYLAFDSKAALGQALVAGEPPAAIKGGHVQLDGEASAGVAFQAVARSALAQIAANAALLRKTPSAEGVHQLRVGVRRLRSALTTFKPILEDEGLETLKTDLKWLSRNCERARSLDVFAEETLRPAEVADVQPAGLAALRDAIDLARRAAWAHAAEASTSERFRALMIDAAAWVETGDWRGQPGADAPIQPFARRALKRHLKTLEKRGRAARGGDDLSRHHLRIEAKKLRYAAEGFTDLYGEKRVRRHLRHLRDLQESLGELNDLVTATPLIAALGLPSDAAFAAGELVGMKAAHKPQLIARAEKALDRLAAAEPFWTRQPSRFGT